ncbi:MAG: hypothetical protein HY815_16825 [Candidatus Riflebacteria bacterium]|nr:hypothetical protein [Candidatus Riflebacteria bacterium]
MSHAAVFRLLAPLVGLLLLLGLPGAPSTRAMVGDPDLRDVKPSRPRPRPRPRVPAPKPTPLPDEEPEEPALPAAPSPTAAASPLPPPTPTPPPPPSIAGSRPAAPAEKLLGDAQAAFRYGAYGEPPGDNAIELARKAGREDPGDGAAPLLEARAALAYEEQARAALDRHDRARARGSYERLAILYPSREAFRRQAKALRAPVIVGVWDWRIQLVIATHFTVVVEAGGSFRGTGGLRNATIYGSWKCVAPAERKYLVSWSHGLTDTVTLSKDGTKLEGTNNVGARISASRKGSR